MGLTAQAVGMFGIDATRERFGNRLLDAARAGAALQMGLGFTAPTVGTRMLISSKPSVSGR